MLFYIFIISFIELPELLSLKWRLKIISSFKIRFLKRVLARSVLVNLLWGHHRRRPLRRSRWSRESSRRATSSRRDWSGKGSSWIGACGWSTWGIHSIGSRWVWGRRWCRIGFAAKPTTTFVLRLSGSGSGSGSRTFTWSVGLNYSIQLNSEGIRKSSLIYC